MELCYETDRLLLKILQDDSAAEVLDFYQKNKAFFEPWEPDRPENFYTLEYQTALLHCEFQLILKKNTLRFWIFEKEHPKNLVGTVSFQNIVRSVYQSCQIGYKLDGSHRHKGYAREAIAKALQVLFQEFSLHRVEALVLPKNLPSIALLEHLGFQSEGLCPSCVYLHSNWEDHLRYSLIASSKNRYQ